MAKQISQYNLLVSGVKDPKTGDFVMTDILVEAAWTNPTAVKLADQQPGNFRQPFAWDGTLTLDQLKEIVEQKILADL